jgi:hypothetical protein
MTNNTIINNTIINLLRGLFGKTLAAAFFSAVLAVGAFAQSNNLYYQNGGSYFGRVTVYSTHFEIASGGGVIKTYRNSCRQVQGNGLYCTFGQFNREGRLIYSGDSYFFQNGVVYLRWLYEFNGNQQRNINGGWVAFRP